MVIHTMLKVPQNKLVIIDLIEEKTPKPCKIHKLGKKRRYLLSLILKEE